MREKLWHERAEYHVIPPFADETRWTARACIPGFRPRDWEDYGDTAVRALSVLVDAIAANPPGRIELPTVADIVGIDADEPTELVAEVQRQNP